jgi:predicted nuclease of predicted toxin-antitoxin system
MGEVKIYTDERVDVAIAEGLQRRGIEAFSARDRNNLGLTDEEQLTFAREESATIFTHDTDFLRVAAQWNDLGRTHCGVIYCRQTIRYFFFISSFFSKSAAAPSKRMCPLSMT